MKFLVLIISSILVVFQVHATNMASASSETHSGLSPISNQCLPLPVDLDGISDDVVIGMARAGRLGSCSVSINSDGSYAIYLKDIGGTTSTLVQTEGNSILAAATLRDYVKAGACL